MNDRPTKNRYGMIIKADYSGDSTVATFEPGVENEAMQVAQDELTAFLEDCISRFDRHPPVFAKRIGETSYTPFKSGTDNLRNVETVLIQEPMVGG